MALPSRTAMAAIKKRKRIDFMVTPVVRVSGIAYPDRNTTPGGKAVKSRSTGVKFCKGKSGIREVWGRTLDEGARE